MINWRILILKKVPFLDRDVPLSPPHGVNLSQLVRFSKVCLIVDDFNKRNLLLAVKLFKQGYKFHRIRKAFS